MKRPKRFRPRCELLEGRYCLAPIGFDIGTVVSRSDVPGAGSARAADLDGDGDLDIVSAGDEFILTHDPVEFRITWSENVDGQGTFGRPQTIAVADRPIVHVEVLNIDSDADLDIVATIGDRRSAAYIVAYENREGTFAEGTVIVPKTQLAGALDVDSDGDIDLVGFETRTLYWYSNERTGEFSRRDNISGSFNSPRRVVPGDIDGDGDSDILILGEEAVTWSENVDGDFRGGGVLVGTRIHPLFAEAAMADFDADGDLDVVAAVSRPTDKLVWFAYDNGSFGAEQLIAELAGRAPYAPVAAFDVDGDQDQDIVVAANGNRVVWFDNFIRFGIFVEREPLTAKKGDISSLTPIDLNGDDLTDFLLTARRGDLVAWYENDSLKQFDEHRLVHAQSRPKAIHLADVDHDDDLDLLAACYGEFLLWKNTDGKFQEPILLNDQAVIGYALATADVDGDEHLDLITGDFDGTIEWQRNIDGNASFGTPQQIVSGLDGLESITVGDADGDGDVDVFSASRFDGTVAWYENTDGKGSFGPLRPVAVMPRHISDVSVADVDGDGDLDVLSTASSTLADIPAVAWYPNQDGRGDFGTARALSWVWQAYWIRARDMDNDGDLDIMYTGTADRRVYLLENVDGTATFAPARVVTNLRSIQDLDIADLDGDGDLDIAVSFADSVTWIENLGGNQFAVKPAVSNAVYQASALVAGDIDRDGRLDLVYASPYTDELFYRRNMGVVGDANGDNVFNSQDLVRVFQFNEYEDSIAGNSTIAEGDFNGDGDFTTQDLVYAFANGVFLG